MTALWRACVGLGVFARLLFLFMGPFEWRPLRLILVSGFQSAVSIRLACRQVARELPAPLRALRLLDVHPIISLDERLHETSEGWPSNSPLSPDDTLP
jgi:hypothetical protein